MFVVTPHGLSIEPYRPLLVSGNSVNQFVQAIKEYSIVLSFVLRQSHERKTSAVNNCAGGPQVIQKTKLRLIEFLLLPETGQPMHDVQQKLLVVVPWNIHAHLDLVAPA